MVAFLSITFFKKLDAVSFNSGTGVKKSRKPLQWLILGEGLAYQTWRLFETKILTSAGYISLFNWLIFLMKHALHFTVKINSRDIQKCDCFWVPSYDLFPFCSRANGDRRSQVEKHVVFSVRSNLPYKSSTVLSEPKFGPLQSKIPGSAPSLADYSKDGYTSIL